MVGRRMPERVLALTLLWIVRARENVSRAACWSAVSVTLANCVLEDLRKAQGEPTKVQKKSRDPARSQILGIGVWDSGTGIRLGTGIRFRGFQLGPCGGSHEVFNSLSMQKKNTFQSTETEFGEVAESLARLQRVLLSGKHGFCTCVSYIRSLQQASFSVLSFWEHQIFSSSFLHFHCCELLAPKIFGRTSTTGGEQGRKFTKQYVTF